MIDGIEIERKEDPSHAGIELRQFRDELSDEIQRKIIIRGDIRGPRNCEERCLLHEILHDVLLDIDEPEACSKLDEMEFFLLDADLNYIISLYGLEE